MRNQIGFAILLGFLVGYPFELSSQPITDEEKKLIQEYLEKKKKGELTPVPKSPPLTKMYYTPALYDSAELRLLPAEQTSESDSSRNEPKSKDLKPFGFDIFNSAEASFAPIPETPVPETYLLGPGDQLLINLWGRADEEYNLSVDREGKIFVPKVGDMVVWGMTVPQFEAKLKTRLTKIYSNFQVSVMLGKLRSVKVFVLGEIKRPGGYTLSSLSTFFSALYAAGGPTERGSLRKIKVLRQNREVAALDLYEFLLKGFIAVDQKLETGDVVYIPVSGPQVKIRGEIKRPAIYELKGGEKTWDLIDLSGGLLPTAYLKQVVLDRLQKNDQPGGQSVCHRAGALQPVEAENQSPEQPGKPRAAARFGESGTGPNGRPPGKLPREKPQLRHLRRPGIKPGAGAAEAGGGDKIRNLRDVDPAVRTGQNRNGEGNPDCAGFGHRRPALEKVGSQKDAYCLDNDGPGLYFWIPVDFCPRFALQKIRPGGPAAAGRGLENQKLD